jgi:hypothetical protein
MRRQVEPLLSRSCSPTSGAECVDAGERGRVTAKPSSFWTLCRRPQFVFAGWDRALASARVRSCGASRDAHTHTHTHTHTKGASWWRRQASAKPFRASTASDLHSHCRLAASRVTHAHAMPDLSGDDGDSPFGCEGGGTDAGPTVTAINTAMTEPTPPASGEGLGFFWSLCTLWGGAVFDARHAGVASISGRGGTCAARLDKTKN